MNRHQIKYYFTHELSFEDLYTAVIAISIGTMAICLAIWVAYATIGLLDGSLYENKLETRAHELAVAQATCYQVKGGK